MKSHVPLETPEGEGGCDAPRTRRALRLVIAGLISVILGCAALYSFSQPTVSFTSTWFYLMSLASGRSDIRSYASASQTQAAFERCPGYRASNILLRETGLTADLTLAGQACNMFGPDLEYLRLDVFSETSSRLHIKIFDPAEQVYQVAESVFPRPGGLTSLSSNDLDFVIVESPFSFAVVRRSNQETLFNTSGSRLIFESQYLRLRTQLPDEPNLYGLGEHTDSFRLNTEGYVRTMWNRDAAGVFPKENLYGSHPIYFDHRGELGTHGVFLLNSNGMDVKIDKSGTGEQNLEYNINGGIFDLYFMAGSSPTEVSQQYAEIAGKPAMMPYFGFGFHQCKYGYRDVYEVAAVVANYSQANIPLETMWSDIDYMDRRRTFTLDPERYPLHKVRELVDYLHTHQQHYVVMVDPAMWRGEYPTYNHAIQADALLKDANGSVYTAVVWPGPVAFPDWYHPNTQSFWNSEFASFFDKDTGVDIDALWIDMNEASNFCPYPCSDPEGFARESGNPPIPPPVRSNAGYSIPGFPEDFQPSGSSGGKSKRQQIPMLLPSTATEQKQVPILATGAKTGLSGRNLIDAPYEIRNAAGSLSSHTIDTDVKNHDGSYQYDTHNLYGAMMSEASRNAMECRRPGKRPLIITRSTFAGSGRSVGHWLGDVWSTDFAYKISISQIMEFSALFQVPMVGSDVCGFMFNTTVHLCQRWTTLGAFYPFFRNHADYGTASHEFYRWSEVADTARDAIDRRLRLLDYLYTAFYLGNKSGNPVIYPLFFKYPGDSKTFDLGYQFFWGDALLVSPVTEPDTTSVTYYLPDDTFYDFSTYKKVETTGMMTDEVPYSSIPIHIRGGSIVPLRIESANTTAELRKKDFEIIVAPDSNGAAHGLLYLDDGESIEPEDTSVIQFEYDQGTLNLLGSFDCDTENVSIARVTVLGVSKTMASGGFGEGWRYNASAEYCVFSHRIALDRETSMRLL